MNENLSRENERLFELLRREQRINDEFRKPLAKEEIKLEGLEPIGGFKTTRQRIREAEEQSRKIWQEINGEEEVSS